MPNLLLVILLEIVILACILLVAWAIYKAQFNLKDSYRIEGVVEDASREDNIYWGYTSTNCYIFVRIDDNRREIFAVNPAIFPSLIKGNKYSFYVINDYVYGYEEIK